MADLLEFLAPTFLLVGWIVLLRISLHMLGMRFFPWWGMTAEKAAGWRRLSRWQCVAIEGILLFTAPMLVYLTASDYFKRRFDPYYIPQHHYLLATAMVFAMISFGVLHGLNFWAKIWEPKFDLPKRSDQ